MEGNFIQVLIFDVEGEIYGIDIVSLDEVIPILSIKSIPKAPSFLEGVINLRGEVLPVVDLYKQFGHQRDCYTLETRFVISSFSSRKVAFIVDGVKEVRDIDQNNIEESVLSDKSNFIAAVAKLGTDEMVHLIALDKVLAEENMKLLSEVNLTEDLN
jgi:purine-binding chemotaxis protein CheW